MFLFAMSAANNLFKKSFKRVIRSPKVFFDTTPIGRILSRFSKDQDVLDSLLISTLSQSLEMAAGIISIFVRYSHE
jgi:ATP-binding cassette subfamily C (CFTR/MRP) protein 1